MAALQWLKNEHRSKNAKTVKERKNSILDSSIDKGPMDRHQIQALDQIKEIKV